MITAIVLGWKRPANVRRIADGWASCAEVTERIVWNNNPDVRDDPCAPGVRTVNCSHDFGLTTRFCAGLLASNDCLLVQDDDLVLPPATVTALHERWKDEPDVLHGLFGRQPSPDGTYEYEQVRSDRRCDIVLTRGLMVHRRHVAAFFADLPAFEDLLRAGRPDGNGEDIALSYVVMRRTGRQNRVWDLPVEELPSGEAIHRRWPGHRAHRTAVVRRCRERLT